MGGIIACGENIDIINCTNYGKSDAGIIGQMVSIDRISMVLNCCNLGECNNGLATKFQDGGWDCVALFAIKNSYNLGKVSNAGILGTLGYPCKERTLIIENCYTAGESTKAIVGSILAHGMIESTTINIKNTYYDPSKSNNVGATQDGISPQNIKNNSSFVDTLNKNIGTNADWKQWKMGEDGYPTFK